LALNSTATQSIQTQLQSQWQAYCLEPGDESTAEIKTRQRRIIEFCGVRCSERGVRDKRLKIIMKIYVNLLFLRKFFCKNKFHKTIFLIKLFQKFIKRENWIYENNCFNDAWFID
jgi:hypothetical protein